jgi:hypothetical protein
MKMILCGALMSVVAPPACVPLPKVLHLAQVRAPDDWEPRGMPEVSVDLQFTVRRDGSVTDVEAIAVMPAHGEPFKAPAIAALLKTRFARVPVDCLGRMRITQKIGGSK